MCLVFQHQDFEARLLVLSHVEPRYRLERKNKENINYLESLSCFPLTCCNVDVVSD